MSPASVTERVRQPRWLKRRQRALRLRGTKRMKYAMQWLSSRANQLKSKLTISHVVQVATVLVFLAMCAILLPGCTTTRVVTVSPECSVPVKPALPTIQADQLASLDDDTYWTLEDRERRLTDWAYLMEAQLKVLCGEKETNQP